MDSIAHKNGYNIMVGRNSRLRGIHDGIYGIFTQETADFLTPGLRISTGALKMDSKRFEWRAALERTLKNDFVLAESSHC